MPFFLFHPCHLKPAAASTTSTPGAACATMQALSEHVLKSPSPSFSLQLTLYTYNWSPDLGANLNCSLTRLLQWQNARSHIVHCLISQKLGLFHHHCFMDTPWHEDSKQVWHHARHGSPCFFRKGLGSLRKLASTCRASPDIHMSNLTISSQTVALLLQIGGKRSQVLLLAVLIGD